MLVSNFDLSIFHVWMAGLSFFFFFFPNRVYACRKQGLHGAPQGLAPLDAGYYIDAFETVLKHFHQLFPLSLLNFYCGN